MRYFLISLAAIFIAFPIVARANQNVSEEIRQIQKMIDDKGLHWTAGQTSMMDLALEERHKRLGTRMPQELQQYYENLNNQPPPQLLNNASYFDWRNLGGVTPVTDQGGCGSCWDFGATACFESAILIATGDTLDLSEQQVLSCNAGGSSCGGGWMNDAYNLFMSFGAVGESCMPYQANDQIPCTQDSCQVLATLLRYQDIPNDVNSIKNALMYGPLSTTFTVYDDFFGYSGGCYEHPGGDPINHTVLIIGWDDDMCDGQGAWIVKNSWGPGWGDHGFFYIKYGSASFGTATQRAIYRPIGDGMLNYDPSSISVTLPQNSYSTTDLLLSNRGFGYLNYVINITMLPRHDSFGYRWNDSDSAGGPVYEWKDITGLVSPVSFSDPNNGNSGYKPLGFYFQYYGNTYNYVRFCTNGFASFLNTSLTQWDNQPIPNSDMPNNLLAAFWDDLTLTYGGLVYYYTNNADSAIITWQNVKDVYQQGTFTFQIILVEPDTIVYQYANMGPDRLNQATIGVENRAGTMGLQVAYNEPYIHDNMAAEFYLGPTPSLRWLGIDNRSGTIRGRRDTTSVVSFNTAQLDTGIYFGNLQLYANDEDSSENNIPVLLTVRSPGCYYTPGDINGNNAVNGIDIVYAVNYFKGTGPNPPVDCSGICAEQSPFYAAGDVNGNCAFNGIDITFFVGYLKGQHPNLLYCSDCPPAERAPSAPAVEPIRAPVLKAYPGNKSSKSD